MTADARSNSTDRRNAVPLAQRDQDGTNACGDAEVFFPSGSAELNDDARARLRKYANCISRHEIDTLYVVGMTDPVGTNDSNLSLGRARARAVADFIRETGTDTDFVIRSRGEQGATPSSPLWPLERSASVAPVSAEGSGSANENHASSGSTPTITDGSAPGIGNERAGTNAGTGANPRADVTGDVASDTAAGVTPDARGSAERGSVAQNDTNRDRTGNRRSRSGGTTGGGTMDRTDGATGSGSTGSTGGGTTGTQNRRGSGLTVGAGGTGSGSTSGSGLTGGAAGTGGGSGGGG